MSSDYTSNYFHYTRNNFDYILNIKEYVLNYNGIVKKLTEKCVNSYLRIPRKIDPTSPIYDLNFEISEDVETIYILITDVIPPSYFNNYLDLPEVIDDIINPLGLFIYNDIDNFKKIPGVGTSPQYSIGKLDRSNLNKIYKKEYGGSGIYDWIVDNLSTYNSKTTFHFKFKLKISETAATDQDILQNDLLINNPVYEYAYDVDRENDKNQCDGFYTYKEFDFEKYKVPKTWSVDQIYSDSGVIGNLTYSISFIKEINKNPQNYYFFNDYLLYDYVDIFISNTNREYDNTVKLSADDISKKWIDCVNNHINYIKTNKDYNDEQKNILIGLISSSYLNGASFSSKDYVQSIIDMDVIQRGNLFFSIFSNNKFILKTVPWYSSPIIILDPKCVDLILCSLPSISYNDASNNNNIVEYGKINDFKVTYDSKISTAPSSWNKYSPYMLTSVMLPTFEKNQKLKDLNKMKIKDIYKLYKKNDNFNIKNYYNYISRLRSHLKNLGFDTKDYISLNFENVKNIKPKFEKNITQSNVPDESAYEIVNDVISKWNNLILNYRNFLKLQLTEHFKKFQATDDFINNSIDKICLIYTRNFENNSLFYPKNIFNLIKDIYKQSSYNILNTEDVFKFFYLDLICYRNRIYSANLEVYKNYIYSTSGYMSTKPSVFAGNEDLYNKIIYPCIEPFISTSIYLLIEKDNFLLNEISNIFKIIKNKELKISEYDILIFRNI